MPWVINLFLSVSAITLKVFNVEKCFLMYFYGMSGLSRAILEVAKNHQTNPKCSN